MQLDRYRKVACQIWLDQKFLSLSDDGKLVFMLILTHPNLTSFGAMKASPASLTDELGWLTERLSEAFQEVLAKDLVHYDKTARLLMLPNFIKHNKPASPNVVISWLGGYKELPECILKDELFHVLKDYAEAMSEAFQEAFRKAFEKPSGKAVVIQRAESSEQKEEQKHSSPAKAADPCPHDEIIALYHEHLPTLTQVRIWNDRRKAMLRSRWREDTSRQNLGWWDRYFRYVASCGFLCGKGEARNGKTPWQADLEWLINSNNMTKVIEGKYPVDAA